MEAGPIEVTEETPSVPDCWDQLSYNDEEVAQPVNAVASIIEEEHKCDIDADNQIILGPGGQWGLGKLEPKKLVVDATTTKVAAWSLPSAGGQSWNFTEITHHTRKKQKLNHKKKKKQEMWFFKRFRAIFLQCC